MTDDIVYRLRHATVADTAETLYQIMDDAALEINELREGARVARLDIQLLSSNGDRWRDTAIHLAAGGCQDQEDTCDLCYRAYGAVQDSFRDTIRRGRRNGSV